VIGRINYDAGHMELHVLHDELSQIAGHLFFLVL